MNWLKYTLKDIFSNANRKWTSVEKNVEIFMLWYNNGSCYWSASRYPENASRSLEIGEHLALDFTT